MYFLTGKLKIIPEITCLGPCGDEHYKVPRFKRVMIYCLTVVRMRNLQMWISNINEINNLEIF